MLDNVQGTEQYAWAKNGGRPSPAWDSLEEPDCLLLKTEHWSLLWKFQDRKKIDYFTTLPSIKAIMSDFDEFVNLDKSHSSSKNDIECLL